MSNQHNNIHRFKLVILGATGVGKTSIVVRLVRDTFRKFESTTGGTFYTHKVELEDDSIVKFNVWDTAGEERFRTIAPLYYRGAAAAIVVYEVTSYPSLQSAKQWIEELKERGEPSMIIALVGNKIDLQPTKDTVTFREADAYADENDLLHFRTSAKTGQNVKEVFVEIAQRLPKPDCVPPEETESEPLVLISRDPVANDRSLARRFVAKLLLYCCLFPRRRGAGSSSH